MKTLNLKIPVIYDVLTITNGAETRHYVSDIIDTSISIFDANQVKIAYTAKSKTYYRCGASIYISHNLNLTRIKNGLAPITPDNFQSLIDEKPQADGVYKSFWRYAFDALNSSRDSVKVIKPGIGDDEVVDVCEIPENTIIASNKNNAQNYADRISNHLAIINGELAMKTHMPFYIVVGSVARIKENRKLHTDDESCFSPRSLHKCIAYLELRNPGLKFDNMLDDKIFPDGVIEIIPDNLTDFNK